MHIQHQPCNSLHTEKLQNLPLIVIGYLRILIYYHPSFTFYKERYEAYPQLHQVIHEQQYNITLILVSVNKRYDISINPFMPTVPTFAVRETDVSRHNGGTSGAPLKPLRDDSVLRALSSLQHLVSRHRQACFHAHAHHPG